MCPMSSASATQVLHEVCAHKIICLCITLIQQVSAKQLSANKQMY